MIPRQCKRLVEVEFPIAEVGRHALAEKARRTGTPHQLHHWWAWRPLASTRAVMIALLLPDPCDSHCPTAFKADARHALLSMHARPKGWTETIKSDAGLRQILLKFIADFSNWDRAADKSYVNLSRALVEAAHRDEPPLVVDPFAGGGSIPLEALRVGCETFASDLNPVSGLILKTKLEGIQKQGQKLVEELREAGERIRNQIEGELGELFAVDSGDDETPIAYLWARTVRCEASNCGAEIPLLRSFWLCKKTNRKRALREQILRKEGTTPRVEFEIFEPKSNDDVRGETVGNANARCLCCPSVLPADRVRAQLGAQNGGADVVFDEDGRRIRGAVLTAVVTLLPGKTGRHYRLPRNCDYDGVRNAQSELLKRLDEWGRDRRTGLCPVPTEPLPPQGTLGFRVRRYGMSEWQDLFTRRQVLTLSSLASAIRAEYEAGLLSAEGASLLAMVCSKLANRFNSLVNWSVGVECPGDLFKGNQLPMGWDFAEANPLSQSSGSIASIVTATARNAGSTVIPDATPSSPLIADATESPLPDESAAVWFTDPPYYEAVPYADLSDFFLVWLKRAQPHHSLLADPFDRQNPLSPKAREAVQDESKQVDGGVKDSAWFENTMAKAFAEGRRVLREDGICCVVFAHKTTEGWEAFLSGMIRGGLVVTASWPIATERAARMRARDSAALATSVHLVCRRRPEDAPTGDWADVLRELPGRVGGWMEHLQDEGVRGADLVFACVGPALEIFSRYSRVETAEGDEIGLPVYLERVWEVVGRTALENVLGTNEARARNGQAGVLEEDARLTALFLWTMQSTDSVRDNGSANDPNERTRTNAAAKGFSLPFDVVRRFAQPMGINLEMWTDRIVEQKKGIIRLLPVTSRAAALFGQEGAQAAANWIESDPTGNVQQTLFPETEAPSKPAKRRGGKKSIIDENAELQSLEATALDRVHAAMLLQSSGHSNALRKLIVAEQDRGPEFLRLANSLSALYPLGSDEKRLLDGMLLAVPR